MKDSQNIMVAMSGGVDSAVAAFLLKQRGYAVTGVTFRLWPPEGSESQDIADARATCDVLSIPHRVFDLRGQFWDHVIMPFVDAYMRGETPNPCVFCNKQIKFGAFWEYAAKAGCDSIATGHYAMVEQDPATGIFRLRRGIHERKDQSYVLYNLTQALLSHIQFPLGGLSKEEVCQISDVNKLLTRPRPESQDICFIPDGGYPAFLERILQKPLKPGAFMDESGKVIGEHKGICHYTIGQRKGLGLSLGQPVFVTGIDAAANTVTVSDNDAALWKSSLIAENVNWITPPVEQPIRCQVKIRYTQKAAPAMACPLLGGSLLIVFDEPQRAITPGQSAVLYDGDYLLGGGIIRGAE